MISWWWGSVCFRRANGDNERDLHGRGARVFDRDFEADGDGAGPVQKERLTAQMLPGQT